MSTTNTFAFSGSFLPLAHALWCHTHSFQKPQIVGRQQFEERTFRMQGLSDESTIRESLLKLCDVHFDELAKVLL